LIEFIGLIELTYKPDQLNQPLTLHSISLLCRFNLKSNMPPSEFHLPNSEFRIQKPLPSVLRHLPSEIHSGLISPSYLLNF